MLFPLFVRGERLLSRVQIFAAVSLLRSQLWLTQANFIGWFHAQRRLFLLPQHQRLVLLRDERVVCCSREAIPGECDSRINETCCKRKTQVPCAETCCHALALWIWNHFVSFVPWYFIYEEDETSRRLDRNSGTLFWIASKLHLDREYCLAFDYICFLQIPILWKTFHSETLFVYFTKEQWSTTHINSWLIDHFNYSCNVFDFFLVKSLLRLFSRVIDL